MKKCLFAGTLLLLVSAIVLLGCHSSSKSGKSISSNASDSDWFRSRVWLNGLKMEPHSSVNQAEFSRQYHLNSKWWDEAFNFLKTNDLINLKPGNYVIDSGNVTAVVSELTPKEKGEVNFEVHHNFNDLQYVIRGKAEMGVATYGDPTATVILPYAAKNDSEIFTVTGGNYYEADPGSFFIFSPKEMHRPAFRIAGYDNIKKIVIKVRVPM
jgi:biofilm protein TabA